MSRENDGVSPSVAGGGWNALMQSSPSMPLSMKRRFERDVVSVLGLPFDTFDLAQAVERVRSAAFSSTRCFISTPNLNFVIAALSDGAFRDSVLRSDMSLPDGAPIVWVARLLGLPLAERVAGASVFDALRAHRGPPLSVFFFGGPQGVAEAACEQLNATQGGLRCVGFDAAGFGSVEALSDVKTIERINASGAHFVVVSLGARKGQAWIERNAGVLTAPLLCHLGAVVNFVAGTVTRAPRWMQVAGLEWLWRIKEEPGLLRRYLRDGAAFSRLVLTRVLPHAVLLRRGGPTQRPPGLHVSRTGAADVEIRLEGVWTLAVLEPLRCVLEESARPGACVALSMREVSYVDNAFVGLLMLACGRLGRKNLRILDVPPAVRAIFWYNAAGFLLVPTSGFVPAEARQ